MRFKIIKKGVKSALDVRGSACCKTGPVAYRAAPQE
ncbi:MAG: hypothetical protein ACD_79C01527G0015 [uncultured bacterium]|nr:MAG: hypothetical protein ACD_79C01527G0015 [uncultured bacterium]